MENMMALIMAAGKDSRMKSKKSKLVNQIYGKEVVKRVEEAVRKAGIHDITAIVGENKVQIEEVLKEEVKYIEQEDSLGTGHAISSARKLLEGKSGYVLILNGNIPLIREETLQRIIKKAKDSKSAACILTAMMKNPLGYGRILRDENGVVKEIIEEIYLTDEQNLINEVNAGIYCFDIKALLQSIGEIKQGKDGKYNITDIIKIMADKGLKVTANIAEDNTEIFSVTDKVSLEMLTRLLRIRINTFHMRNGVTIEDMNTTYIYDDVKIGEDTVIRPNTTIKSGVVIGEDCDIGPNAYIREGCVLADKVKVGSFVEIKKADIGYGSKVPHLSYMGDCKIGEKCNIGCGTITCNYDGFNKSKTIIGDHSFIGSNTNLVAPVTLGNNVFVAAGSTITDDVEDDSLAIARQRQVNKKDWNKK